MIAGALDVVSTWSIEHGTVRVVTAWRGELVRHAALRSALLALGQVTHCRVVGPTRVGPERIGYGVSRGVVQASAFKVLERWGYATRAIAGYVALTELGRAALARCHSGMRASHEVTM